jgi:hypothetical protein
LSVLNATTTTTTKKKKKNQAELQKNRERDLRVLEVYKKEMKRMFDAATAVCSSEDAASKMRRKYDDAQEAVFSASQDEGRVGAPSPPPQSVSPAVAAIATPLKPLKSSMEKVSLAEAKPKKLSGKNKKEKHVHDQNIRLINMSSNARLLMTPQEFCDPRKNYARLYMNGDMPEIEHVLLPDPRKQDKGSKLVSKGANTLRKSATSGLMVPTLPPAQEVFAADDEEDDEEEEEEGRDDKVASKPNAAPKTPASTEGQKVLRRFESVGSALSTPSASAAVSTVTGPPSPVSTDALNSPDGFSQLSARKARTRGLLALRRPRTDSLVEMYEEGYEARLETMLLALKSKSGARDQHIVSELLSTEEDYLHDLGVILSIFGKLLKPVLSEEDFKTVFSNLEHIRSVHILLLADLKSESFKQVGEQDWGVPFIKHATKLRAVYDVYTSGQADGRKVRSALERDAKVMEVLAGIAEKPEVRNLDLKSYLIKPVQRICKYPLLLRELQKSQTDPKSSESPISIRLEVARLAMAEILESTNDQMIISEGRLTTLKLEEELNAVFVDEKVQLALPLRQFVCSDTMMIGTRSNRKRKKPVRLRLTLFSDVLLLLAPLEGEADVFYLKQVFPLSSLVVTNVADGALSDLADVNDVWEFRLRDGEDRFFVCSPSPAVKDKWLIAIAVGAAFQEKADQSKLGSPTSPVVAVADSPSAPTGNASPSGEPVIRALQDVSTPDEVVQWLRADPERKRAQELAKKGIDKLAPGDRKQWESLHEKARSQKRETLRLAMMEAEDPAKEQPRMGQRSATASPAQPIPSSSPRRGVAVPTAAPRNGTPGRSSTQIQHQQPAIASSAGDEEEFIVFSTAVSPRK